ncbi:hypothetical protein DXG03_008379 [Asterophora parasitica]|uniref:Transmembrane protein n=1 Tax=Asterophora parasitica TaxID=117018 RepID=A0A9P7G487_9AGAR|nr:hypothetical protein DXG03_008379 [Asterophora parasitica]
MILASFQYALALCGTLFSFSSPDPLRAMFALRRSGLRPLPSIDFFLLFQRPLAVIDAADSEQSIVSSTCTDLAVIPHTNSLSIIPPTSNALSIVYDSNPIPSWYFRITEPNLIATFSSEEVATVTAQPQATSSLETLDLDVGFANTQINNTVAQPKYLHPALPTITLPRLYFKPLWNALRVDRKVVNARRAWIVFAIALVGSLVWVLTDRYLTGSWCFKSGSRENVLHTATKSSQETLLHDFELATEQYVPEPVARTESDVKYISASQVLAPHLDEPYQTAVLPFLDWLEENEDMIERLALPTDNGLLDAVNRNMSLLMTRYTAQVQGPARVDAEPTNDLDTTLSEDAPELVEAGTKNDLGDAPSVIADNEPPDVGPPVSIFSSLCDSEFTLIVTRLFSVQNDVEDDEENDLVAEIR